MDAQEETTDAPRWEQWSKGPRLKGAAMSEEGEDIWQDLREDLRAEGREANSQNLHYTMEND
jgi:hypothetical protein